MATPLHLEFERDIIELQNQIDGLLKTAEDKGIDVSDEVRILGRKLEVLKEEIFQNLTPLEQVQVARHPKRPYTLDYISRIFTDWVELSGDRGYRDDGAVVGGWARLNGDSVMVIGHQKGRDMKENLWRNFGSPHPEGYRKALRLMGQAQKFGHPIITFIDTPGAYPGVGAEERGQAEAIARNLREMAGFRVPIISLVIGEGGSGGALALGVANRILMLEHSIYSVISPEGCAAILWRTAEEREKAARALKLTSRELFKRGIADEVIPEPPGGAHSDWDEAARRVKEVLLRHHSELKGMDADSLISGRQGKFEAIGEWEGKG
ncbi:MAG: acetyl-CoA carboxylase carboxyltransferase subunit alpha [Gemmatimonadota bacterium]